MQGIYKITNLINQKSYIGKSKNIEERWQSHLRPSSWKAQPNKPLYRAFKKYGIQNFSFIILEELSEYEKNSNEREKYWIQYFNTYENGYNATLGGDGGVTVVNPREKFGKLTIDDVVYLRKRYLECRYPASLIYEKEFKNKITKRGFQAIWLGQNAKEIMPEVFTEVNKKKQIQLSREYEGVLRRRISLEEKQKIKKRIKDGETMSQIWKKDYQHIYKSVGGFRDMINAVSLDEKENLNELKAL